MRFLIILVALINTSFAEEKKKDVQDMSDPLAVYTQAGLGITDKGLNIKLGKSYDPNMKDTMAMNVIEIKGVLGEALGWAGSSKKNNSIDSYRLRNFKVNTKNGRGSQIDIACSMKPTALAHASCNGSYGVIQALPKVGIVTFYPLLGAGIEFGRNVVEDDGSIDSGYSAYGVNSVVGMYSRIAVSKKFWLNYNPFWVSALSGSENYKKNAYGNSQDNLFLHEFAASFQMSPVMNLRYFANWNNKVDFMDGDQRIELNIQF